jgi:hypothetical protein
VISQETIVRWGCQEDKSEIARASSRAADIDEAFVGSGVKTGVG